MRKPLKDQKPPRRQRSSGVRPVLDEEVTRVETPTARQKEEALSKQVTLPRLPDDFDDSGEWASDEPNTEPDTVPEADESLPADDEEPTIRQRPGRLPREARMTLPSRNDIDRRALPFAKPEGLRDEDEPLELAATVKAPSSSSLGLEAGEVRDDLVSLSPCSDSPWSQHAEIDREALPSSMMPPPVEDPEDEEGIQRARRATLILWVAVASIAVITLIAMFWT